MMAMTLRAPVVMPPIVRAVGHIDHPDFREVVRLLHADAQLVDNDRSSELVLIAQSRPGQIGDHEIQRLRRAAPLAGIVGLLGTWCEGESRTGRPWPGVSRLYWYEFPAWWQRQLALRAAGRCPDWARPGDCGFRIADCGLLNSAIRNPQSAIRSPATLLHGLIVVRTHHRDTACALADIFQHVGYATIRQRPGRGTYVIRGAAAGIWDGGQLDTGEADDLARFCRALGCGAAPIIALLDFPRRESVDCAFQIGACAVYSKPWQNDELIAAVQGLVPVATRSYVA